MAASPHQYLLHDGWRHWSPPPTRPFILLTFADQVTHREKDDTRSLPSLRRFRLAIRYVQMCGPREIKNILRKKKKILRATKIKTHVPLGTNVPNLWQKSISTSTRVAQAASRSPSQPPAAEGMGRKCWWMAHCWKSCLQCKCQGLCRGRPPRLEGWGTAGAWLLSGGWKGRLYWLGPAAECPDVDQAPRC